MNYEDEEQVQQFKLKRMIKHLSDSQGLGTSMITVIIPPGKKISDIQKMLGEEIGKAEKIKDRVNRQSVSRAITSAKERLKQYNKVPPNGLFVYSGEVMKRSGKSDGKVVVSFEPYKAINTTLYKCSNVFIVKPLKDLLASSDRYGFIIVDGAGTLYGTIEGNARNVLNKFSVDLPKKHGRGGQSSQRFGRIRLEKRQMYVKKVCELAVSCFIEDEKPNISGLVVAGYADFKNQVADSPVLDQRLKKIIVNRADISYGGEQGFNQAIDLSKGCLAGIKLVQEQKLIGKFYEEINMDTGKFVYGIQQTMNAVGDSVVEKLIVWDSLEIMRVEVKNIKTNEIDTKYMSPDEMEAMMKKEDNEFDILESEALIDWLAENHKSFGTELAFVTDKSPEGHQFVQGFGGIGGFLRFKWENTFEFNEYDSDDDEDGFM